MDIINYFPFIILFLWYAFLWSVIIYKKYFRRISLRLSAVKERLRFKRKMIDQPIILTLIFIPLYVSFQSIKYVYIFVWIAYAIISRCITMWIKKSPTQERGISKNTDTIKGDAK